MTAGSPEALTEWVRRAARGEEEAFRYLFLRCRPLVVRVAQSFAGLDAEEVKDVVQESFARAFRGIPRLGNAASFQPWLLTIARNRARSLLETRARRREVTSAFSREPAPEEVTVVPAALQRERTLDVVRAIIDALPEGPEKETVRLFYVEGELSAREIAERMNVGKSAVTMRLDRFRAKVKQELVRRVLAAQWE